MTRRRGEFEGIPDDQLLDIAVAINRDIRRAQREEEEPQHLASPLDGLSLREQRLFRNHQLREERRLGIDHAAEAEQRLLDHLRVVYGPQEADFEHRKETPRHVYRRLYFPDYVNVD